MSVLSEATVQGSVPQIIEEKERQEKFEKAMKDKSPNELAVSAKVSNDAPPIQARAADVSKNRTASPVKEISVPNVQVEIYKEKSQVQPDSDKMMEDLDFMNQSVSNRNTQNSSSRRKNQTIVVSNSVQKFDGHPQYEEGDTYTVNRVS